MGVPRQSNQQTSDTLIAEFIARWTRSDAAERANYQLFLSELCDILEVPRPNPTVSDDARNDYVFERAVIFDHGDGTSSTGRTDLYKRGSFVLEAKQGSAAQSGDEPALFIGAARGASTRWRCRRAKQRRMRRASSRGRRRWRGKCRRCVRR
jgi:hypothetical protein